MLLVRVFECCSHRAKGPKDQLLLPLLPGLLRCHVAATVTEVYVASSSSTIEYRTLVPLLAGGELLRSCGSQTRPEQALLRCVWMWMRVWMWMWMCGCVCDVHSSDTFSAPDTAKCCLARLEPRWKRAFVRCWISVVVTFDCIESQSWETV